MCNWEWARGVGAHTRAQEMKWKGVRERRLSEQGPMAVSQIWGSGSKIRVGMGGQEGVAVRGQDRTRLIQPGDPTGPQMSPRHLTLTESRPDPGSPPPTDTCSSSWVHPVTRPETWDLGVPLPHSLSATCLVRLLNISPPPPPADPCPLT